MPERSPGPERTGPVSTPYLIAVVFMPFAAGYYLSYLYRSVNAIIAPQLIEDAGLSAGDLGLVTSAYFLAFAAFQIPLGLLLDRFGPRKVHSVLLLVAAAGALVFALGESMLVLMAGRALIGLGVSGALMAAFKAINLWFPRRRWPLVNGCLLGMGGLGAISATAPVEMLLNVVDWRGIFVGFSVATCIVSLVIFLAVPEKPGLNTGSTFARQVRELRLIYGNRLFWRLAPVLVASLAAQMAIQGLWAGGWLTDVAGFGREEVADTLFVLAACLTLSFVVGGVIADLAERYGVHLGVIVIAGITAFAASQAVLVLQLDPRAIWPWILFGLTSNLAMVSFPLLVRHFAIELSGRVNTGLNLLIFVGVFASQTAMGEIIDLWPSASGESYAPEGYQVAFGIVLALQLLAFLWLLAGWRRLFARPTASQASSS